MSKRNLWIDALRAIRTRLRAAVPMMIIAMGVFVLLPGGASGGTSVTLTFSSGSDWQTFSEDPGSATYRQGSGFVGSAQAVCLNWSAPWPCPSNALLYDYPGWGWPASLDPIPSAVWIWAAKVTPQTAPADLAGYFFSKSFVLPGRPTAGQIFVAADDFAEVRVNGSIVGTIGSTSDIGLAGAAQSWLTQFDVTALLKPGANVITVRGQNGPWWWACSSPPAICDYSLDPAGVVFGGSLTYETDGASATAGPGHIPGSMVMLESPTADSYCDAWDVNLQETVVGECDGMPVRWDRGVLEVLDGPLQSQLVDGTIVERPLVRGRAVGINAAGQILAEVRVRVSTPTHSRVIPRAAIWAAGAWHDLSGLDVTASADVPPEFYMSPRGINAHGDVVLSLGDGTVAIWHRKSVEILPILTDAGDCFGYAINDAGQAVGSCTIWSDTVITVPVLWNKGSALELASARTSDVQSYARAINDNQLIGGTDSYAATVWPGRSHALMQVASTGVINGVNERGEMVGSTNDGILQAAWWRRAGSDPVSLAGPANSRSSARAISESGVVVGWVFPEGLNERQQAFIAR